MKWVSHEVVTGMAVYTLTGSLVPTACAMAGAVLPDWIEGKGGGVRLPWAGLLAHRGWSHWPLLYVLGFLALGAVGEELGEDARSLILAGRFILLGALFHIAEDALCGKVPLLHPKKKVGVRLFRVGSFGEYILALVLVLFFYGIGRLVLW